MVRLTVVSQSKEETVLKIEGWVSRTGVAVLEEEGTRLFRQTQRLVLDLEDVKSIDRTGIALLQRWSGERLVLRGASPFVRTLLAKHGVT